MYSHAHLSCHFGPVAVYPSLQNPKYIEEPSVKITPPHSQRTTANLKQTVVCALVYIIMPPPPPFPGHPTLHGVWTKLKHAILTITALFKIYTFPSFLTL